MQAFRGYRQGVLDQRVQVSSGSPFEATAGFSRGVRVGPHIAVAGTAPIWPDGEVDPDPYAQARRCWEIAIDALVRLGGAPRDVLRTRTYLTSAQHEAAASRAHGEVFGAVRPASTMVVVAALLDPRWVVEVELDAILLPPQDSLGANPSGDPLRTEPRS